MKEEINLLPRRFVKLRRTRLIIYGVGRFLQRIYLLLLLTTVALGGVFLALRAITASTVQSQNEKLMEAVDDAAEVAEVNALLQQFDIQLNRTVSWSLYVEDLLEQTPAGVTITELSVESEGGPLQISGQSSSQAAIVKFQQDLQNLPWVERLEAPLQNFAIGPDAGFSFSLFLTRDGSSS